MKRIELYVDGQHFVIEECEGRAEIRHAEQPRAMAARSVTVYVGRQYEGIGPRAVELKVEKSE